MHAGSIPSEEEGRLQVVLLQGKVPQGLPANHQKLGQSHNRDFLIPALRRNQPHWHLDVGF